MSPTHNIERDGTTITVAPKNEGEQSGLVVICHGLGDTAEGFAGKFLECFVVDLHTNATDLFHSFLPSNIHS